METKTNRRNESKPSTTPSIVAIAIDLSKKSKYAVNWALQNLIPEEGYERVRFKLLHVFPEISTVPTPIGIEFPVSQVRDDVVAAYRKELEWRKTENLLPYKMFCIGKEVQTEIVQIESDDAASAIAKVVVSSNVDKLVLGASSTGRIFSRGQSKSSRISECCPRFCTVYVVSNGKLSSVRPSFSDTSRLSYYPTINNQLSSLYTSNDFSSGNQVSINVCDVKQLRMELKHLQGMYAKTQIEVIDASRKINVLHQQRMEETVKLREISLKEEDARALADQGRARYEDAKREANYAMECMEREVARRKAAEERASRDARVKEKLQKSFMNPAHQYLEFSWDEILLATSSFSDNLKVGMGSYGTVYKCNLRHATAAVKILLPESANRNKQFQQELQILSRIRHPNLLTLLGACPDRGCLVYEYMENGSLDERLMRKNNTPPIPWFDRYRIMREVATALVFLHNSNPKPVIHRNLKPANILLDHNYVSKIGDVGLSTMLHHSDTSREETTLFKNTSPVGSLCYIDPEYQRTGLVSVMSDVYAFGMVVLRLLTAKPAIGLTRKVEMAIERDSLERVLDVEAGEWPIDETKSVAVLGLRCTELRHGDRPDLKTEILPALEKLTSVVRDNYPGDHFICPIRKDVMKDPCVAADGYSYDRSAIQEWLGESDESPVTNLPMRSKRLIPNYTLLSAIMEWKSRKCFEHAY